MANIQFLYLYLLFVTVSGALSGDDDQCGASDYRTGERIRNGTVVPQGKYPWLAYLSNGCTATIVSRKYILTAGHCVCQRRPNGSPPLPCDLKNHHEIQVVVGSVNHLEGQEFKTKRMIPHEKYLAPLGVGVTYDIALIELEEELTYSKDVRPICLSAKNQEALADRIATTAGWGDIYGNGTLPERLLSLFDYSYTEYEIGPMMCTAIYNHTVTDHGDSGGPVMIMTDGRWTEVGITSYGKPPELGCPPGVYARVSHFCDWIAEKTNNEVRCDA
ncbi:trypsin domain-containing protein [Ditylenchus destructor]|uniref:Trypsin domain-containing protein n=1 Tax=Ditylenchus destructor TaxID=166010 RepID=A0AAD4R5N0_9BILA|nr:trypsin domain-containing protein [Ditylenchus destructor]